MFRIEPWPSRTVNLALSCGHELGIVLTALPRAAGSQLGRCVHTHTRHEASCEFCTCTDPAAFEHQPWHNGHTWRSSKRRLGSKFPAVAQPFPDRARSGPGLGPVWARSIGKRSGSGREAVGKRSGRGRDAVGKRSGRGRDVVGAWQGGRSGGLRADSAL